MIRSPALADGAAQKVTRLLREYNRQRTKSLDEVMREELVSTNPANAYRDLIAYREEQATVKPETMTINGEMSRSPTHLEV